MDTSEVYIKMCDCPEVQRCWKIGMDAMAHPATDSHDYAKVIFRSDPKVKTIKTVVTIWLPRQDQIQEMYFTTGFNGWNKLSDFYSWANRLPKIRYKCNSMEQLWLAFYMYYKHQKVWDGEKWKTNKK